MGNPDLSNLREPAIALLEASIQRKDPAAAWKAYSAITSYRLHLSAKLRCQLIKLLPSCGRMPEALQVFHSHEKDVYTWSAIILAHAQLGQNQQAMVLYKQMNVSGVTPSSHTFVAVLKACADIGAVAQIHNDIINQDMEADLYVGTTLVDIYAKHGNLQKACDVFEKLPVRNVVSWSAMIAGYTNHGQGWEALSLFRRMQQEGCEANEYTFMCILRACTDVIALVEGKLIHSNLVKQGFQLNVYVGSSLIDMYAKCNSIEDAQNVFSNLPVRNVCCWNAIISGYAHSEDASEALHLFKLMQQAGMEPDDVTFLSILKACASMFALDQGKLMHIRIMKQGLESDSFIGNSLVDMYAKCVSLDCACKVFDLLKVRSIISWNTIIGGRAEQGYLEEALLMLENMQREGTNPNSITFLCIVKACAGEKALDQGRMAFTDSIKHGLDSDSTLAIALVDMFSKCGDLDSAQNLFDKLHEKTVVSCCALMAGYTHYARGLEALQLFERMGQEDIKPNFVTYMCILKACASSEALQFGSLIHADIIEQGLESILSIATSLISMYAKCGSLFDARRMFDRLVVRDVITWSALIEGYVELGFVQEAFDLFERMQHDGTEPNVVTLATMLKACGSTAALNEGKLIHADVVSRGYESDMHIGNTLIDMYAKCGTLDSASSVFDMLPRPDVISWSTLIEGYANHGHCQSSQLYFQTMQQEGFTPVSVTFVSILSACSNAGLIEEGEFYFKSMKKDFRLSPVSDHYVCMVDLLGRAGQLEEAENVANRMPIEPDSLVWMTLLGACAKYGNLEVGTRAFDSVVRAYETNGTAFIIMSNIYAANDLWEDAKQLQALAI